MYGREEKISSQESLWQESDISDYHIKVIETRAWHQFEVSLVVRNGKVLHAKISCGQALMDPDGSDCNGITSKIDATKYTIEELFNFLNNSRSEFNNFGSIAEIDWHDCLFVSFDEEYHFPKQISFDHPQILDEEYSIQVSDFTIIEEQ